MIRLFNLSKIYYQNGIIATGISKVNATFDIGEFVVIVGESGSGKSTLLNVISGLDSFEEGEMFINDEETSHYVEEDFEEYRRKYVANIFQAFNLVNSYTVRQNVELVLLIHGYEKKKVKLQVNDILKKVGLWEFRNRRVSKLSGGQKQRVAIARALAKETPIIVADEPTGNLDQESANGIFELLSEISKDKLVIVVTHNIEQVEKYATRIMKMHDGKIIEDKKIKKTEKVEIKESIHKSMSFSSKMKLSFRNAFNVFSKFALVFAVFFVFSFMLINKYHSYKQSEYETFVEGISDLFTEKTPERVIIKKNNGTRISEDDFNAILNLDNVNTVVKNDINDFSVGISTADEDGYELIGRPALLEDFDGVITHGRMPKNDNEILFISYKDSFEVEFLYDFYLDELSYLLATDLYQKDYETPLTVVGVGYSDDIEILDSRFYVSPSVMSRMADLYSLTLGSYTISYNNGELVNNDDSGRIVTISNRVPVGEIYISSDYSNSCDNKSCSGKFLNITNNNLYFTKSKEFKVTKIYNSKKFKRIFGIDNIEEFSGMFFINPVDAKDLSFDGYYQSSVYIKDISKLDDTVNELNNMGYYTLKVKDTFYSNSSMKKIFKVLNYFSIFITIIVLIVISSLVINLILKSRNRYYAVIRMLGGTLKINKQLISMELFIVSSLAYSLVVLLNYIYHISSYSFGFISDVFEYMKVSDFIVIYLVIIVISQIISSRFAKSIFKDSMITTYNMEV